MSVSLCLSGGGSRGAFHLGVLQYLDENNIEVKNLSGSSIGSVIAASYASGVSPKKQLEILTSSELKSAIKFNYFKKGIFKIDDSKEIFNELLPIKNIENISKNLYICVYDIKLKKIFYLNQGSVKNACLSSCALVPIFRPIKDDIHEYIDGGLKDNLPITPLLKYSEKILASDLFPTYKKDIIKRRTFKPSKILQNLFFEEMLNNLNKSISKCDYYLSDIRLKNYSILSFDVDFNKTFELGYETANKTLSKIL